MINCEWIRKQKKERPSLGSSPGLKCKPNVRLRVRCANTQQPCFSALCDAWLLRKRDEIRESSYIKYRAILERHIKPRLGSRRLSGICTASVDAFTRELLETDGLSVKTVHDILSVLHSVLKDTEARRPAGALAVQIRYPKGKRREMRVLTIEEQKRLVAYLLHPTDSCKFGLLLALYTGLRIGELCALRWSCIDLREQTIRIAATMQRLGGTGEGTRIVIGAPKSDSSLRTIPLPAQIAVLCRHMQPADPEAYVLTGGPAYMEPRTLQYRLKRYTAACGLEGVHAHTLRHTFATRAIESGFELKSLSEVLGHATTAITMEPLQTALLSAHREENIDTEENFRSLFTAVNAMAEQYGMPVLYSCHPRSRKRLEESGFQLDRRVIAHKPLGFHDYNCLQMNAFCVVSDSGTLPEESSFYLSVGKPFPAVCIRTSTERPEALDKGCFVLSGIHTEQLLQSIDLAVQMQQNGEFGTPVPDYTAENVSVKVARIIQSYTGIVDRFIWRK